MGESMTDKSFDQKLDEMFHKVFVAGVGTNSEDIKGNETAYINLQKNSIANAKKDAKALISSDVIGEDEPEEVNERVGDYETEQRNALRQAQRKVLDGSN